MSISDKIEKYFRADRRRVFDSSGKVAQAVGCSITYVRRVRAEKGFDSKVRRGLDGRTRSAPGWAKKSVAMEPAEVERLVDELRQQIPKVAQLRTVAIKAWNAFAMEASLAGLNLSILKASATAKNWEQYITRELHLSDRRAEEYIRTAANPEYKE